MRVAQEGGSPLTSSECQLYHGRTILSIMRLSRWRYWPIDIGGFES
jgi:hypothetical protein